MAGKTNAPSDDERDDKKPLEDDEEPNKKPVEDDEEALDREAAVTLYRALKDPETGKEIIASLARKAGLLEDKQDKKPSEAQMESLGRKILKEKLGSDYGKFADMVGPALDELIQTYIQGAMQANNRASSQSAWEAEVDKFVTQTEITPAIERKMLDIMQDYSPNFRSPSFNAQKFLTKVYKEAIEDLGITVKPKKSRVEVERPGDFTVRRRPKVVSLDDAIDAAMKGIRFSNED